MAALILFGGGGDLAMRMLLPSLYFLEHDGLLPEGLKIIGAARSEESADDYIAKVHEAVKARAEADQAWDETSWSRMKARLDYLAVDATSPDSLKPLKDKVGDGEVTSFLAVSPSLYARIVTAMKAAGLADKNCRIVLEKPVGRDLKSFLEIDDAVAHAFSEDQVFRIDHYLGKQTLNMTRKLREWARKKDTQVCLLAPLQTFLHDDTYIQDHNFLTSLPHNFKHMCSYISHSVCIVAICYKSKHTGKQKQPTIFVAIDKLSSRLLCRHVFIWHEPVLAISRESLK